LGKGPGRRLGLVLRGGGGRGAVGLEGGWGGAQEFRTPVMGQQAEKKRKFKGVCWETG